MKETLEEAAENYSNKIERSENGLVQKVFSDGAKWRQERTCEHNYIITVEQGHRVIKCLECSNV